MTPRIWAPGRRGFDPRPESSVGATVLLLGVATACAGLLAWLIVTLMGA